MLCIRPAPNLEAYKKKKKIYVPLCGSLLWVGFNSARLFWN